MLSVGFGSGSGDMLNIGFGFVSGSGDMLNASFGFGSGTSGMLMLVSVLVHVYVMY